MNLFVVGAGSVGTFLAAKLTQVTEVTLIARDSSVQRFTNGVSLQEEGRDSKLCKISCLGWNEIREFPSNSSILLATKAFHLKDALREIAKRTAAAKHAGATKSSAPGRGDSSAPTLVFCQNGLGILD